MRPQTALPIILSLLSFSHTASAYYYRDSDLVRLNAYRRDVDEILYEIISVRAAVAGAEATANAPYSDQQDWPLFVPRGAPSGQSAGGGGGSGGGNSGPPGGKTSTTGPTSKGGGSAGNGGGSGGGFGDLSQFMNQETARLKQAAVAAGKKPNSIYQGCGALSSACG